MQSYSVASITNYYPGVKSAPFDYGMDSIAVHVIVLLVEISFVQLAAIDDYWIIHSNLPNPTYLWKTWKCQPQTHIARVYHCKRVEFYSYCGTSHPLIRIHYIRPADPGGVKVVALMISINRSHLVHFLPTAASERDAMQVAACRRDVKKRATGSVPPRLFLVVLHGRAAP
ncbi:hypothetical protein AVEN_199977-1 [Araneus ventricosus]|uniref:Uncharacterized protein n=1 Tax=Araneus ventricosus TaxID=182803 RepID=A0A4Y2BWQ0_ARAVE|nr:hypothetical protein AVEN_199977-1 [Araneus ventricosus]